jgi:Ca2+-binding EF-hand superfamily protein
LNNSGSISPEELRVVLSKMYRFVKREEAEELIRKYDRNNDGLIQYEEFVEMIS